MAVMVDQWSLAALQIEMCFNETIASHGTGSLWRHNERTFLVTNWHNFTGRHRETNAHISRTNCEPNNIVISYLHHEDAGLWIRKKYPLYDSVGQPLWYEHPNKSAKKDLVALEVATPEGAQATHVNELPTKPIHTEIGDEVFAVGYPFKIDVVGLPVWKRASLASELKAAFLQGSSRFLIDTATRKGMSGSLVIQKKTGSWLDQSGSLNVGTGTAYKLMGIYSGRLGANSDGDAQLGLVWPTTDVEALIQCGTTDLHLF